MKEIKLLYLYADMLELYGDYGNIQVLKYRLEKRGIKLIVDKYSLEDNEPDFNSYDIIFAGGGADKEQSILSNDLIRYKKNIKTALNNGVFFLLICGAYQLFGKYYKDVDGNIIPGLEIFDYYTEAIEDRKKRCIGNIIIKSKINDIETEVIGFENHGGQTYNIKVTVTDNAGNTKEATVAGSTLAPTPTPTPGKDDLWDPDLGSTPTPTPGKDDLWDPDLGSTPTPTPGKDDLWDPDLGSTPSPTPGKDDLWGAD